MSRMHGASAYARVGMESQAMKASPHQLITMLFDGFEKSIRAARLHLKAGNIEERGKAISKAMDIVSVGLAPALDVKTGGEMAENLMSLYEYVNRLLLQANRDNSDEKLQQALDLIESIASAWREVGGQGAR